MEKNISIIFQNTLSVYLHIFSPLIKQFRLSLIKSREEMNSSCITITGTPFTIYKTLPITKNPASHYMHM